MTNKNPITPRQLDMFKDIAVYRHDKNRLICAPLPGPGENKNVRTSYEPVTDDVYLSHLGGDLLVGLYAYDSISRLLYDFDDGQQQFVYERQRHIEQTGQDYTLIFRKNTQADKWYGLDILTTPRPLPFTQTLKTALINTSDYKQTQGQKIEVFPTANAVFMPFRFDYDLVSHATLAPVAPGDKGREIEIAYNWITNGQAVKINPAGFDLFISEYQARREIQKPLQIDRKRQRGEITINGWRDYFEIYHNGLKAPGTRNEFLFWFVSFCLQQGRSSKQTVYLWLEWLADKHNNNSKDCRNIEQNRKECISWYKALADNYQGGRISLDFVTVGRREITAINKIALTTGVTRKGQLDKVTRLLTLLYCKALLDGSNDLDLSKNWFNTMGFKRRELGRFDPVRALIHAGLLAKVSSFKTGVNGYNSKPITYRLLFVDKNANSLKVGTLE